MQQALHNHPGNPRFIAGPFPFVPNLGLIKLSLKLERQYTHLLAVNPKAKLKLRRIEKKFAAVERVFRKLSGNSD